MTPRYVRDLTGIQRRWYAADHEWQCKDDPNPHGMEAHEPFDDESWTGETTETWEQFMARLDRHGLVLLRKEVAEEWAHAYAEASTGADAPLDDRDAITALAKAACAGREPYPVDYDYARASLRYLREHGLTLARLREQQEGEGR